MYETWNSERAYTNFNHTMTSKYVYDLQISLSEETEIMFADNYLSPGNILYMRMYI